LTRTEVQNIDIIQDLYSAEIVEKGIARTVHAKSIVNAAGPWVEEVLFKIKRDQNFSGLRLIKGSHIVTKKLFSGDHSYIFQNSDGRTLVHHFYRFTEVK